MTRKGIALARNATERRRPRNTRIDTRATRARRRTCVVVTCEHGGNQIPARWAPLFRGRRALLDSHRGWDPGALALARKLAKELHAPLFAHTTSRLLVDLNRSEHHRGVFSSITRALPADERERLLREIYRPHRAGVERCIATAIARGERVVHVAAHSFTPVLNGEHRRADVGLLYDPARRPERAFCAAWLAALADALPDLTVRRNSPYRGNTDGLTTALRRRHAARDYVGIEVEVNQRLLGTVAFQRVARVLAATARPLVRPGSGA